MAKREGCLASEGMVPCNFEGDNLATINAFNCLNADKMFDHAYFYVPVFPTQDCDRGKQKQ